MTENSVVVKVFSAIIRAVSSLSAVVFVSAYVGCFLIPGGVLLDSIACIAFWSFVVFGSSMMFGGLLQEAVEESLEEVSHEAK